MRGLKGQNQTLRHSAQPYPARTLLTLKPCRAQLVKVCLYYFLVTSLIIFPMGIVAGSLGIAGGVRYIRDRKRVGSFDASKVRSCLSLKALKP